MSMQVNNNSGIIPTQLHSLFEKAGISETKGADDKPALVFSIRVDGVEQQITVSVPDDLEIPETIDEEAINTLCEKLSKTDSFNLSDAQIEGIRDAFMNLLASPGVDEGIDALDKSLSASGTDATSGASHGALFDIYQLMALLCECAQTQRDAARDLRTAESLQIQTTIQNQANTQRSAAVNSMIASACCCLVQVGAMGYTFAKQASAFKTQMSSIETSGVGSARQNLTMVEAGQTSEGAAKQLNSVRSSTDQATVNRVETAFAEADVATSQAQSREVILNEDTAKLARVQNTAQPLAAEDIPEGVTGDAIRDAQTRIAEFNDLQNLQGQQNLNEADTQRMNELQNKYQGVTAEQLQTELNTARTQYATELQQTVQNDRTALNGARTTANNKIDSVLKSYEDAYDTAVRERANVTSETPKAEIKQLDANLKQASTDLKYARAYATNERVSVTTADERQVLTTQAEARLTEAQTKLKGDTSYIKAEQILKRGESLNMIINAVGNCGQSMIQFYNNSKQADATKLGSVETAKKEELEQAKDLYNQAGDILDQVVQLMQSIISSETESMRDAIHA